MESRPRPPRYPRVYGVRRGWKVTVYGGSLLVGALGAVCAYVALIGESERGLASQLMLVVVALAFVALGLYTIVEVGRSQVTLTEDELEICGLRSRRVPRDKITGRRLVGQSSPATLLLVLAEQDSLRIPLILDFDDAFQSWVADIPDLDAQDAQSATAQMIEAAAAAGKGTAPYAHIRRARRLATTLAVLAVLSALWGIFWPRPYHLAMLACGAIPLASLWLMARFPGIVTFDGTLGEERPHAIDSLVFPSAALVLRGTLDFEIIDWVEVGALGAVFSVLASSLALRFGAGQRRTKTTAPTLVVILFCYGVGGVCISNALLDRRPPTLYSCQVLDKRVAGGRLEQHYLTLSPWGPRATADEFRVHASVYSRLHRQAQVQVAVHPGALGARWFEIRLPAK